MWPYSAAATSRGLPPIEAPALTAEEAAKLAALQVRLGAAVRAYESDFYGRGTPGWVADRTALLKRLGVESFAVDQHTGEPWQEDTILWTKRGRDAVVVAGCGGGKSFAAVAAAIDCGGVSVIVSPLSALANELHATARRFGATSYIFRDSTAASVFETVLATRRDAEAVIVILQPEVFASTTFREQFLDKLCASDNQPVTLVVLEEVDLYRHFASFRDVMLQVGATLTRLRTATVSAGVAAAAAAEGLPRGDSNVRVMAITGTMTVDLEARIRELMGIRESAYTYRSQAPVRKLPFMVFVGPKPRTERQVSPAYVTIAVDTAVAARAEQRQRNADTADDRARGHAEAVAIEMAALARLTSDQAAAELAAAELPVGDTAGAAAHTAHLGRIAVERSAVASARVRADAAAREEVSGIVVVSASRKVAIGICEKAREELVKVDIDCATLHGKNNPNLKGFTASQQQLGLFGLLTATRAGVIGLNYRAHKIVLIGAFNDPSFFIQAAHRVDRGISGIATVELYSACVHWIAAQVQLRTALSEGQTACKGAVATSPVGRKAIAAVCLREAALADFNEIRGILFGGKCIRVGLSLAMCPESPIRSCINDDTVPLGSACSRCLADAAGWAGGIDVLLEATAQEEMFRILSVLTGDGKNSTTFDLLVAAIKASPVFKAMKTRDRDHRGTPRVLVLQPQAVAAAVARSALLVEGIEPVRRATGAGAKTAKKGKGAKAAGPVVFQYALWFYDWNKYAAPEGLGGYAAGTFPHNAVIVFPLFHQNEYEVVLSFATKLSAKNAGDQPPLAESDNMECIEEDIDEDRDSTDDSAFGSPVIQRRDPGAAGGQDDAITAKIAEMTAAVGDVPLMQRLIAELAGLNGASGGLDTTRLLKTKAPRVSRGDRQLSQPPEQQAAKKSRQGTSATAKGTGSTGSRKRGKKGAKKKR